MLLKSNACQVCSCSAFIGVLSYVERDIIVDYYWICGTSKCDSTADLLMYQLRDLWSMFDGEYPCKACSCYVTDRNFPLN